MRLLILALVLLPAAAQAQDNRLVFRLGGGVASDPGYFGSDESVLSPDFAFSFAYANVAGYEFGDPDPYAPASGISFGPSFRIVGARLAEDYPELAGLEDIETAYELGVSVGYAGPGYEVFGAVRRGFGGHEGVVAELGADAVFRVDDQLVLTAGPRLLAGNDAYAATYFGVTEAEALASAFPAYEATGGLISAGIEVGMDYRFAPDWSLYATARWDRLQGDAADSPIVRDDTQVSLSLGVTRVFDFRF